MSTQWRGVFPAVTTQFHPDLSLDLDLTAKPRHPVHARRRRKQDERRAGGGRHGDRRDPGRCAVKQIDAVLGVRLKLHQRADPVTAGG